MYYVATAGKKKGKILNLDESEFDHETGLVKDDEGNTYRIDSIRPLTKEEQEKYLKVEEIKID